MRDLVIIFGSSSAITNPHRRNYRLRCISDAGSEIIRTATSSYPLTKPPPSLPQQHSAAPSTASVPSSSSAVGWNPDGSVDYYADLASKLAEDGRIQDVALIAETLGAVSGAEVSRFASMLDFGLLKRGICFNFKQGKIESVIQTLVKLEKVGIAPLDLIDGSSVKLMKQQFRGMVNSGEMDKAVGLMEILAGFGFKIKELVDPFDIVKTCVDYSNPHLAIRYAFLLPHAELLFCRIIHGFGKKGDMVSVMAAYEACKQVVDTSNMYIWRTMIDVCGLCDDHMKSRYIYEDLLKQNIKPNIYVLNSLMNVNSNDLVYTLEIYRNMQKLDVAADMATYNILLKTCCFAGRVDLARDIYREAKRMESSGVLKLDAFTYCTIIKVFADAKLWKMALKVKEDMQSAGVNPNTHTWSSLISACANAGLVEHAIQLFDEMLAAGSEPNSQCFNILLHACVEACQYDRTFRLFQSWNGSSVEKASCEDNINNNGLPSLNNRSDSRSKRLFFKPTTATYNILLKACGTDYYRGRELMDEMKSLGLAPNLITWSTLINMCGSSGDVEGAVQILRTMHAAGTKPDVVAYTTAIKVCVESKKLKLAFSLFEEMRRYRIKPNLVTYNTLLRARSRYGSLHEVRQSLAIYQDMRKAGYKPKDYFLKELIEEWCEGVIQEDVQNQDRTMNQKVINSGRPVSILIEKLAAYLRKRTPGNLAIDLQGLTKVEARIVVLAVLCMIKEDYIRGEAVRDDVIIIIGTAEANTGRGKQELEVKDALVKLLKDELGVEVLPAGPKHARDGADDDLSHLKPQIRSTRRPAILQRLLVTKESLFKWLQRKSQHS